MKKTVSLALVVLMIAAMFSVFTLASSADDDYTLADGVLTVKADIECNTEEYPWHANRAEVTKVVVADGVTKVGHHAFTLMENLTEITFGKDATVFGNDAFSGCPNLKTVTFNAAVTSIGQGIAYNSKAIETVNLYNQSEEAFKTLAAAKPYNLASNGGISTGFDTCTYKVYGDVADEVIKLEIAPRFGQVENWPTESGTFNTIETTKTWFIVGGTSKAITDKLTGEGKTLNMKVTVVDETEGKTYVIPEYFFDTPTREIYSDGTFVRIAACEYGIVPVMGHTYTIGLEFSDVETGKVKYAGTSAVGAFNSFNDGFKLNGPVVPDPIPHPQVPEATKIKIVGKFGNWENWINSPNKGDAEAVTQLLVGITDEAGQTIDLAIDGTLTWKVTISAGDTSKTITMTPATKSLTYQLYRFETCLGEGANQFVPVKDTNYTVKIEVYEGEVLKYESEAVSGFTCPMDPIVPEVVTPPTGDTTAVIVVLAVVAMIGTALVVSKKVLAK
ncbi:MAG: leucine-rich repeat protein [Eubacteriales bacterium]